MKHKQNYLYNLLDDRQWSLPGDDTFLAGTHTRYRMLFHWRNTQAPRMMDNYPRKCTARPWDQTPCRLQSTCRKHWCTGQDLLTNDTQNNSKWKILTKSNVSSLIHWCFFFFIIIYLIMRALFCKTLPLSSNALLGTDHFLQLLQRNGTVYRTILRKRMILISLRDSLRRIILKRPIATCL